VSLSSKSQPTKRKRFQPTSEIKTHLHLNIKPYIVNQKKYFLITFEIQLVGAGNCIIYCRKEATTKSGQFFCACLLSILFIVNIYYHANAGKIGTVLRYIIFVRLTSKC